MLLLLCIKRKHKEFQVVGLLMENIVCGVVKMEVILFIIVTHRVI